MKIRWHRDANGDLLESAEWYNVQQKGLGREFILAVDQAIKRIVSMPDTFAFVGDDVRSCQVDRFPFTVHYRLEGEVVRILVIKHHRRHPDYGSDRR